MCVFTYVCVPGMCQPLSVPRDGGGGLAQCLFLCAAGHPACPQSTGPRPHLCLATPFPLRGPLHFTLGLSLASPLPTFPGAPLWKEGRLWPRACGSLMRLGVRGCGGQPAQGRTLCFKDRKPNLLTQGSLGDRRDLVSPSLRLGVFPLWPSTQPGASPAQGCLGLSCCLPQQVSRRGPL